MEITQFETILEGPIATHSSTVINFATHFVRGCSYTISLWVWLWRMKNPPPVGEELALFTTRSIDPNLSRFEPIYPSVVLNVGQKPNQLFFGLLRDDFGGYMGIWPHHELRHHEWTHVALTITDTSMNCFINGKFLDYVNFFGEGTGGACPYEATGNNQFTVNDVHNTIFQLAGAKRLKSLVGLIQDVRIIRGSAISPEQVVELMNSRRPEQLPTLLAAMRMFGIYSLEGFSPIPWEESSYLQKEWGLCPVLVCGSMCLREDFLLGDFPAAESTANFSLNPTAAELAEDEKELEVFLEDLLFREGLSRDSRMEGQSSSSLKQSQEALNRKAAQEQRRLTAKATVSKIDLDDENAVELFVQRYLTKQLYTLDDSAVVEEFLRQYYGLSDDDDARELGRELGWSEEDIVAIFGDEYDDYDGDFYDDNDSYMYLGGQSDGFINDRVEILDGDGYFAYDDVPTEFERTVATRERVQNVIKEPDVSFGDESRRHVQETKAFPDSHALSSRSKVKLRSSVQLTADAEGSEEDLLDEGRARRRRKSWLSRASLPSFVQSVVDVAQQSWESIQRSLAKRIPILARIAPPPVKENEPVSTSSISKTTEISVSEAHDAATAKEPDVNYRRRAMQQQTLYGEIEEDDVQKWVKEVKSTWKSYRKDPRLSQVQSAYNAAMDWMTGRSSDQFSFWNAANNNTKKPSHSLLQWKKFNREKVFSSLALATFLADDLQTDILDYDVEWSFRYPGAIGQPSHLALAAQVGTQNAEYFINDDENRWIGALIPPKVGRRIARMLGNTSLSELLDLNKNLRKGTRVQPSMQANKRLPQSSTLKFETSPSSQCFAAASYYFPLTQYVTSHYSLLETGVGVSQEVRLSDGQFIGQTGEDDSLHLFYEMEAAAGNPQAQVWLGRRHFWGYGGLPPNAMIARRWFERAAAQGDPEGLYNLGVYHMYGRAGLPRNEAAALEHFQMAANGPNPFPMALHALGNHYREGSGKNKVGRNLPLARDYYRKASELGSPEGAFSLAMMLREGLGGDADIHASVDYLAEAASGGHLRAMNFLSHALFDQASWLGQYQRELQATAARKLGPDATAEMIENATRYKNPIAIHLPHLSYILPNPLACSCEAALPLMKHIAEMSYRPNDLSRAAFKSYLDGDLWAALEGYEELGDLGVRFGQENAVFLYQTMREQLCLEDKDAASNVWSKLQNGLRLRLEKLTNLWREVETAAFDEAFRSAENISDVFQWMASSDSCHAYFDAMIAHRMFQLAQNGNSDALLHFGDRLRDGGKFVQQNETQAALLYSSLAELGNIEALMSIGWLILFKDTENSTHQKIALNIFEEARSWELNTTKAQLNASEFSNRTYRMGTIALDFQVQDFSTHGVASTLAVALLSLDDSLRRSFGPEYSLVRWLDKFRNVHGKTGQKNNFLVYLADTLAISSNVSLLGSTTMEIGLLITLVVLFVTVYWFRRSRRQLIPNVT